MHLDVPSIIKHLVIRTNVLPDSIYFLNCLRHWAPQLYKYIIKILIKRINLVGGFTFFLICVYMKKRSVFKYYIKSLWANISVCYFAKTVSKKDGYRWPMVRKFRILLIFKTTIILGHSVFKNMSIGAIGGLYHLYAVRPHASSIAHIPNEANTALEIFLPLLR